MLLLYEKVFSTLIVKFFSKKKSENNQNWKNTESDEEVNNSFLDYSTNHNGIGVVKKKGRRGR